MSETQSFAEAAIKADGQFIPDFNKRAISYSAMKEFIKSPMHLVHYYQTKKVPTPAMLLGSMVDLMLFTPDEFEAKYRPYTNFRKQSDEAKAKWAAMVEQAKKDNVQLIDEEDLKEAKEIVAVIKKHPQTIQLLSMMTSSQRAIRWTDKKTGIPCVTIPDADCEEICMDLKISINAHPDDWKRYFFGDSELTMQVGFLLEGFKSKFKFPAFKNVVVESKPPYGISINYADDDVKAFALGRFRHYMDKLKFCIDNNCWHMGYEFHSATGEFMMSIPGYLRQEYEKYQ